MKKYLIIFLLLIIGLSGYAQIRFENGYFISNEGVRTDCLIKNIDWQNNPKEFLYKINKDSEIKSANISGVAEFGVLNQSKYKRFDVDIDQSTEEINALSNTESPEFKKEQVFLKVLIEGKASLYLYESKTLKKYFMSTDSLKIEQLIFKSYLTPEGLVATNNTFRKQIWNNLRCSDIEMSRVEAANYKQKELIRLFATYNNCQNSSSTKFDSRVKKDLYNLSIRPGINWSSVFISNSALSSSGSALEKRMSIRLGLENEFVLGFNKNKWAILFEPVFQYFKSEGMYLAKKTSIDYKSIEFQAGIRHYMFLNNTSKMFLNGNVIYDLPFSSIVAVEGGEDLEITSRINSAVGMGYKYKDKYGVELKYMFNRNVLGGYTFWGSKYKTIAIVFSYTIL